MEKTVIQYYHEYTNPEQKGVTFVRIVPEGVPNIFRPCVSQIYFSKEKPVQCSDDLVLSLDIAKQLFDFKKVETITTFQWGDSDDSLDNELAQRYKPINRLIKELESNSPCRKLNRLDKIIL